ncbi:BMP family ABC transporter substrate-binding protein [Gleimia sp. 6138-11-ORH1]|uniref:BMP family lipoprotein n=1 Tax=Gleimia sp. 6138-11-ORH1 TaxID=2973937 RepID=UPI002167B5DC|nr:BMP family ABC transporter substrate-binding protein [Gleimia sp. 6138-11-ORH1]MCS4483955.1 BMP family ABC transporter substrate-binding protein [Gleimia sp. 6138-11-ORH1]
MKNTMKFGALVASAALMLSACGGGTTPSADNGGAKPDAGKKVKACMVSDEGGFEDKSFNQSGFEGLKRAEKELGTEIKFTESHASADYDPNIEALISDNCDIIIGVGYQMADIMKEKAAANPDVKFAIVDFNYEEKPENLKPLVFNTAEASYLAGYVSAGMTAKGKIGTFLGMNIPTTAIFSDGFEDGMKMYNEEHGTDVKLLGWDKAKQDGIVVGGFSDVPKGQTFSNQLIEQGVDVIMPVAGPVGAGTLAAAREANNGTMVVWVDADGYNTQPEYKDLILTSVVKEIGTSVFDTIKALSEDSFSGEAYIGNLKNGGVSLAPFHDFEDKVPAEVKEGVKKLEEKIKNGEIKVESKNQP